MDSEDHAWLAYQRQFSENYDSLNYASGLQAKVMRSSHRMAERAFDPTMRFDTVLEVGAGTGEHLPFVRHDFGRYLLTDRDPRTLEVAHAKLRLKLEPKLNSTALSRISFEPQQGERLVCADSSVDRLIATHVLEHLYHPHLVLKEWIRVVKNGGVISILIPCDPGLAWRLGRHLGARRRATQKGMAYDYVMAREHVNSVNNLIAFIRHYFPIRQETWWPLRVPSIDLNLFYLCHATVTKTAA